MYDDHPDARSNTRLGRYELVARLATGGMGEIFLARLEGAAGFEKLYVIKRILPHLAGDVRFRAMMIDEARIASRLSHPSICQVYELGETDGDLYIVMEHLEGLSLVPLLRHAGRQRRPLELGLIAGIAQQVAAALHYAHELRDRDGSSLNIIHRDVTPSNIFVTESGVAKVLDFGIAKAKNMSAETQTGTVKGKHAYMAPEQLRGEAIDRRVDVYALGVLIYEMLALRRLFQRRTDYLTLQAVMEQPVPDIRAFRPDAPPALATALYRALHRDRAQRFETVRQLGDALEAALAPYERAWPASQLGEHLAARFAPELERRRVAVSAALARAAEQARAGALARLPAVAADELDQTGGPGDDGDEDDDLPPVDTAVHAAALGSTGPLRALPEVPAPHGGAALAARARPLALAPPPAPAMAEAPASRPSRSWLWPAAALALLAVGGSALWLLWRSRAPAQTVLVVTDRRAPRPGELPAAATTGAGVDAGVGGPDAAPASVDAGPTRGDGADARPGTRKDPKAALTAHISSLRPEMDACLARHPVSTAISGKLQLQIEASGEVAKVELEPAALAATEMAGCIKRLFRAQRFPRQREPLSISLSISARVR